MFLIISLGKKKRNRVNNHENEFFANKKFSRKIKNENNNSRMSTSLNTNGTSDLKAAKDFLCEIKQALNTSRLFSFDYFRPSCTNIILYLYY